MPYNQLPSVGEKETSCGGYRDLTLPCYYQHSKPLNTEKMLLSVGLLSILSETFPHHPSSLYWDILCIPHVTIFFYPGVEKIVLALYTLISVSTFSVLFSVHFLFY